MAGYSTHPTRPMKPLLPAWVFSVLIHGATLVILCAIIQPWSRGVADAQRGSMGIVLHRAIVDGISNPGSEYDVVQAAAFFEAPAPPELLAAAVVEANESAATNNNDPPKPTAPASTASGASKGST